MLTNQNPDSQTRFGSIEKVRVWLSKLAKKDSLSTSLLKIKQYNFNWSEKSPKNERNSTQKFPIVTSRGGVNKRAHGRSGIDVNGLPFWEKSFSQVSNNFPLRQVERSELASFRGWNLQQCTRDRFDRPLHEAGRGVICLQAEARTDLSLGELPRPGDNRTVDGRCPLLPVKNANGSTQ